MVYSDSSIIYHLRRHCLVSYMTPALITLLGCLLVHATASSAVAPGGCGWPAATAFCRGPASAPAPPSFERGVGYPLAGTAGPASEAPSDTSSPSACCCLCASTERCNGWTLNGGGKTKKKTCYLKTRAGPSTAVASKGCVSAVLPVRPPPPPYVPKYPTPLGAKNVLFLAVDDMRPSLGAYNFTLPGQPTHSPRIDQLASEGLLFKRAYVQYAFCSPSRNSFMSGRRPDTTKVWEFTDHFREEGVGADWVTMPQYFKQYGYLTLGGGKLYHPSSATENIGMPDNDYPASWSPEHPYFKPTAHDGGGNLTCANQGPKQAPSGSRPMNGMVWCEVETPKESSILYDQQVRDNCMQHLELASNLTRTGRHLATGEEGGTQEREGGETVNSEGATRPFFVGCGFHKPHAPHFAPKEFFDRLPQNVEDIPLPLNAFAPVRMPEVAWHPYADVSGMDECPSFNGTVNMTRLRVYRRSYYASISYQDYNIGVILDKLDALGHSNNTVVVLFGDHGYQLGEHDTWAKMTNFELGVHIPLVIRAPWMESSVGKETAVLAEMVDVYPTLAALAGLPDPKGVEGSEGINGTSLAPVFVDPSITGIKTAAFSQFAKDSYPFSVNPHFTRNETQLMGYTIRTDEWRYTAWFRFDNRTEQPGNRYGKVLLNSSLGTELYDHRGDTSMWLDFPGENVNVVEDPEHAGLVSSLHQRLLDYIQLK